MHANVTYRPLSMEEAIEEFESELHRLDEDHRVLQERYESGHYVSHFNFNHRAAS